MLKAKKIKTFLWFDGQAEEAAEFYCSIFPNSKITAVSRYPEGGPREAGMVMTVSWVLDGEEFTGINGGPEFKFNESVSFAIECDTQEEIDYYWDKLLAGGGKPVQCGWLKDRYGLSWQIVPRALIDLITGSDTDKAKRAFGAMLEMKKLDIAKLERAAAG